MDQSRKKASYSPPHITKVVLRKEQAVLSQCSLQDVNPDAGGAPWDCFDAGGIMPNGCKKGPSGMGNQAAGS